MAANETSKQVLVRIDVDLHNRITEILEETGDKSVPEFLRRAALERLLALGEGKTTILDMLEVIAGEATAAFQHVERVEMALGHLLSSNKLTGDTAASQALFAEISNKLNPPKPPSSVYGNRNFVLVNTNRRWRPECEADMLKHHKASAYYQPWGKMIENNIREDDWVVLYASGDGIVAYGQAASDPKHRRFDWDAEDGENETYVPLKNFYEFKKPVNLKTIREWSGYDLRPRRTVVTFAPQAGASLVTNLQQHQDYEENDVSHLFKPVVPEVPDFLKVTPKGSEASEVIDLTNM